MTLRHDLTVIGRQSRKLLWLLAVTLLPLIYLLSGFYSVGAQERGLVMRFGKIVEENVLPGMHYHLPWPFETAQTLPVTALRSLDIDFTATAPEGLQPELTTGDQDLVDVALSVQYNISEPGRFASAAEDSEHLLWQMAMAETLYYISAEAIDQLLTTGRTSLQNQLRNNLQQTVTDLELGIRVTSVQIRSLGPPTSIKKAFDGVAQARSDKQKLIQESAGARHSRLAEARSQANRTLQDARAYATEVLARAAGNRDHFLAILSEYEKAPELATQRVYLEKLEAIVSSTELSLVTPTDTAN